MISHFRGIPIRSLARGLNVLRAEGHFSGYSLDIFQIFLSQNTSATASVIPSLEMGDRMSPYDFSRTLFWNHSVYSS